MLFREHKAGKSVGRAQEIAGMSMKAGPRGYERQPWG